MASLPLPGTTDVVMEEDGYILEQHQQALRGYLRSFIIRRSLSSQDASVFLDGASALLLDFIRQSRAEWIGLKTFLSLKIVFSKGTDTTETIRSHFNSTQREIHAATDIHTELKAAMAQILLRIEEFLNNGSNWVVDEILHLDIHLARYKALRGGSTFVTLPSKLRAKRAIINVRNDDKKCFMWSILSALHPADTNGQQTYKYGRYQNELNFRGIDFPVNVKDIDLILVDGHCCWVKNLDALLSDQRGHHGKKYFCRRCLLPHYSEQKLLLHYELCRRNAPTRTVMSRNDSLEFKNYHRNQRAPYVIYCDFEAILPQLDSWSPSRSDSYTTRHQHHEPCSFELVDIFGCCSDRTEIGDYFMYRGEDPVKIFLDKIVELTEKHQTRPLYPKPRLNADEWRMFNDAKHCYLCGSHFVYNEKVRDHCHYCSRSRGAAHYDCNLSYRLQNKVQVVFHNLKSYDGHMIMQEIGGHCGEHVLQLDCIAKRMEDCISFSLTKHAPAPPRKRKHAKADPVGNTMKECSGEENEPLLDYDDELTTIPATDVDTLHNSTTMWKIVFIDSFQFLPSSLDVLVSNLLTKGSDFFPTMLYHFDNNTEMMLRKGIYPYEYMDSWERFLDTTLPLLQQFYSSLSDASASASDYEHAVNVWTTFTLSNMGQYHYLYLKTDVWFFCDVFQSFRAFSQNNYGLDPAHYYTLLSLGWDACLKLTKVRLELLHDVDMYQFCEAGIRGGISVITHRYAKANNIYLPDFNPDVPTQYTIYVDMNNLYGTTMIQPLPVRNFHWTPREEIEKTNWTQQNDSQSTGYVLEVDLEYPQHVHSAHNDYPLAPEKLQITNSKLSPYCRELKHSLGCISGTVEKLVPNLNGKSRYILHYRNLQLYLQLGMVLRHVYRAISFTQAPWMNPYINFNTEMRKQATTDFEKDLFKLLNNAVFGKTMENVRQYMDVHL